ncbi:MAG: MgtC/SapB family protein [Terriglobia bacterium]
MDFALPLELNLTVVVKLLLAAVLGALVGLERELHGKPAGLRTNMFICLGSALFTILSVEFATRYGGDATRIASQLIPGIGFIGAGSIIRARGTVTGLTTAATIFVLASIGMAIGAGSIGTALFVSALILVGLWILGWMQRRLALKTELRRYLVRGPRLDTLAGAVVDLVGGRGLTFRQLASRQRDDGFELRFELDSTAEQHNEILRSLGERQLACEVTPASADKRE